MDILRYLVASNCPYLSEVDMVDEPLRGIPRSLNHVQSGNDT